ncbi:transmembrane protein, putative (macronuclear) [Tetrahymena thermophila SB210]|uniref:Transmembrane protein, putative n=1 Tax=Tetrahymena thermophila (strain SB210) TaxID=312017 RepID=Q232H3_TETTS|nr:transmembrane protein, putative [Tetrahymena thermophila SB210]EAR91439.2 transmembrane protein, putative [Tetrahymena thermophila SB210]|eukprot:XP_001011684.2 transmembrane protein, putative [Tetrahymena thermophila SB210]
MKTQLNQQGSAEKIKGLVVISIAFAKQILTSLDVLDMNNNPTRISFYYCSITISDNYECLYDKNFQLQLEETLKSFCKRVNSMFLCLETTDNYVLKRNQFSIESSVFDDKCSMFSEDGKICESPKSGYTFVIPDNTYILMDKTMCAIYNSTNKTCEKYYYRFLPVEDYSYSVFFKDFQNFEKIQKGSTSKNIKCQTGYKLLKTQDKIGCVNDDFFDPFCSKADEFNRCQECIANYAINAHTGECQYSTVDNCLIQVIENPSDNFSQCLLCQKGYKIVKEEKNNYVCKKWLNCQTINKYPPYECLACFIRKDIPEYANDCRINEKKNIDIYNQYGGGLKCKDNENFFLKYDCVERKFSKNCPNKSQHPLGDFCTSLGSDRQFWLQEDVDRPIPKSIAHLEPLKISSTSDYINIIGIVQKNSMFFKSYGSRMYTNTQYYQQFEMTYDFQLFNPQQITQIQGCLEYSLFSDLCVRCEQGIVLVNSSKTPQSQCSQDTQQIPEGCLVFDTQKKQCLKCSDQKPYCQSPKIDNCRKQFYEKCLICEDGYTLTKQFKCVIQQPDFYYTNFALFDGEDYCFQGFYFQTAIKSQNGEYSCQNTKENCINFSSSGKCNQCQFGYSLNQDTYKCQTSAKLQNCLYSKGIDTCTYCQNSYQLLNDGTCKFISPIAKCQDNNLNCQCGINTNFCILCDDGFKQATSSFYRCDKVCKNGQIGNALPTCSQQIKCQNGCQTCAFNNTSFCYSCQNGVQPIDGSCDSKPKQCKPNEFLTQTKRQVCIKCPDQCSSCSSLTKCITCVDPSKSVNLLCNCKLNQFYHENTCIDKCPYGWKKSETEEGKCIKACPDGQYAIQDKENNFLKCSDINSDSNLQLYCSSLIGALPDLLTTSISNNTNDYIDIKITFSQSEIKKCFTFKVVSASNVEQQLQDQQTNINNKLEMIAHISKKDISQSISEDQNKNKFIFVLFQIFQKDVQKQEVKIKLTTDFALIPFEIQKNFEEVQKICQNCEIPNSVQVQSTLQVSCKTSKNCSSNTVSAQTEEDIEIVQTTGESSYQSSRIEPHEFRITTRNSTDGSIKVILDHPFSIDQSQPGKILYKFKAPKQANNSTIRITSKVLQSGKKRLLESDQVLYPSKYKYLVQSFQIQIQEKSTPSTDPTTQTSTSSENQSTESSQDNSTNTQLIIIIVFSIVGGLVIIGIVAIIYLRKKNRASKFRDFEIESKKSDKNGSQQVQSNGELKGSQELYGIEYI